MKKITITVLILILLFTAQFLFRGGMNDKVLTDNDISSMILAGLPQGMQDQLSDLGEKIGLSQQIMLILVIALAVVFVGILIFIIFTIVKLSKINKNLKVEKKKKKELDLKLKMKKKEEKQKLKALKAKQKADKKIVAPVKSVKQEIKIEPRAEKPVKTEIKDIKDNKTKPVSADNTAADIEEENLTDEDIYIVNKEIKDIADGKFEGKDDSRGDSKSFVKIENPDDEFVLDFDIDEELNKSEEIDNELKDESNNDKGDETVNVKPAVTDDIKAENIKEQGIDESFDFKGITELGIDESLNMDAEEINIDDTLNNQNNIMSEETAPHEDNLIDFSQLNNLSDITNENIILDKPQAVDSILDKPVKQKITDIPRNVKIIDDKHDKEEEVFSPEEKIFGDKKIYISKKTTVLPKCFESYLQQSDESVKWCYNELKNELLAYKEVHSRIITGCEIFRKSGIQAKILIKGKTLYIYLRISTEGIDPTYVKVKDMSGKKAYAETPTEIRVSGKKKVNRCKELIASMFEAQGIEKRKDAEFVDYAKDYPEIPNAVIYSRNLVYKN